MRKRDVSEFRAEFYSRHWSFALHLKAVFVHGTSDSSPLKSVPFRYNIDASIIKIFECQEKPITRQWRWLLTYKSRGVSVAMRWLVTFIAPLLAKTPNIKGLSACRGSILNDPDIQRTLLFSSTCTTTTTSSSHYPFSQFIHASNCPPLLAPSSTVITLARSPYDFPTYISCIFFIFR